MKSITQIGASLLSIFASLTKQTILFLNMELKKIVLKMEREQYDIKGFGHNVLYNVGLKTQNFMHKECMNSLALLPLGNFAGFKS